MAARRRSKYLSSGWWSWQGERFVDFVSGRWRKWRLRRAAPTLTADERWAKWLKHLELISAELHAVYRNRAVFRRLQQMFHDNPRLNAEGGWVYRRLLDYYAAYIVIAVRREVDTGPDGLTLLQILMEMRRYNDILSRERFMSRFENREPPIADFVREMGKKDFDRWSDNGHCISHGMLNKDLKELRRRTGTVVNYANKRVAHRTLDEATLTITQSDEALAHIEEVMQKYYTILAGPALVGLEPAIQFDWENVFTFPWIEPQPSRDEGE